MSDETEARIVTLAREWSIPATTEVVGMICLYMRRLLEWNLRINLTGARSANELLGEHLADSCALSRLVPHGSNVVDVGSGGGLPALPFSLLRPDCLVTLVEPRAKRVAFLNTAVRECSCRNVSVKRARLDSCREHSFDVATSRATFPPALWLKVAPALLVPGGRLILLTNTDSRPTPGSLRLVDSLEYPVVGNTMRWAASYCST
jgi:16S rRNA (guanine(527)-N(7))-methyltransferase RsmG